MTLNSPSKADPSVLEDIRRVGRMTFGPDEVKFQAMWDRHRYYLDKRPALLPRSRTDYRDFCRKLLEKADG